MKFPELKANSLSGRYRDRMDAVAILISIAEAALNLRDVKGRHHAEIAYKALVEALKEIEK